MSSELVGSGPGTPGDGTAGSRDATAEIKRLRDAILECDRDLMRVIARRRDLVVQIGNIKKRIP